MNGGGYRAATAGGWTAVSLPYRGSTLAMVALLPGPGAGNCAVPTAGTLAAMTTSLGAAGTARPGTGSGRTAARRDVGGRWHTEAYERI